MTRELVLVHGRAQQDLDPDALKAEWIEGLRVGLAKNDLDLPIDQSSIRFPYYGNALVDMIDTELRGAIRDVVVRGAGESSDEREFFEEVVAEIRGRLPQFSDEEIVAAASDEEIEYIGRGFQNSALVVGLLKLIDEKLPGLGGTAIALATNDVYHYLMTPGIQDAISDGVRAALSPDVETVVVGHSLGSVVAYKLLREEGPDAGWHVPHFITLGSPLGVTAIRRSLAPIGHPAVVKKWSNALDPRDIVSLHPLEAPWFTIRPAIVNKTDVRNETPNRHGIGGYVSDPVIARWIFDSLTTP